ALDGLGLNVSNAVDPSLTEHREIGQRAEEGSALCSHLLDGFNIGATYRREKPFARTRNSGVHRRIIGEHIDASRESVASRGKPIVVIINFFGFGPRDLANWLGLRIALGLIPGQPDLFRNAIHRFAARIGSMVG